jgi:hypothetical protein
LYGIISFDTSAKVKHVARQLDHTVGMVASGRYRVHVVVFVTQPEAVALLYNATVVGQLAAVQTPGDGLVARAVQQTVSELAWEQAESDSAWKDVTEFVGVNGVAAVSRAASSDASRGWLKVSVVRLPRRLGGDFAWVSRAAVLQLARDAGADVTLFFEDDHQVRTSHLDAFLSWTACEHLPLAPTGGPFTGAGAATVQPGSAIPWAVHRSCSARVPSDWIVGWVQVGCARARPHATGQN